LQFFLLKENVASTKAAYSSRNRPGNSALLMLAFKQHLLNN